MKKFIAIFIILALFAFCLTSCKSQLESEPNNLNSNSAELPYAGLAPLSGIDPKSPEYQEKLKELGISQVLWNNEADKDKAVNIEAVQNTSCKNASGVKITSNAHSDAFPGIYFIWDSKQKDSGFLKVSAPVFDFFESFTLTAKQANVYWDFLIAPIEGQQLTEDNCYVFFIPKVNNNKNINMVFLSGWILKEDTEQPEQPENPEEPDEQLPPEDGKSLLSGIAIPLNVTVLCNYSNDPIWMKCSLEAGKEYKINISGQRSPQSATSFFAKIQADLFSACPMINGSQIIALNAHNIVFTLSSETATDVYLQITFTDTMFTGTNMMIHVDAVLIYNGDEFPKGPFLGIGYHLPSGVLILKSIPISPDMELPADPVCTGYIFGGWFLDYANTLPLTNFDSLKNSTKNVYIYAKWIVDETV